MVYLGSIGQMYGTKNIKFIMVYFGIQFCLRFGNMKYDNLFCSKNYRK